MAEATVFVTESIVVGSAFGHPPLGPETVYQALGSTVRQIPYVEAAVRKRIADLHGATSAEIPPGSFRQHVEIGLFAENGGEGIEHALVAVAGQSEGCTAARRVCAVRGSKPPSES